MPNLISNLLFEHLDKFQAHSSLVCEKIEIFLSILDKYPQKKQKFMRANGCNFVTKNVRKAIMKRSKIRNKYLRERPNEAKSLCNK